MIRFLKNRLRLARSDEGIALVMVISVGAVLTLLIVAGVAMSIGSLKKSASDSDWNAALAAAYAGIEEYQSRLTDEPAYVKYGNPASKFSNPTNASPAKVQLPPSTKENPAFGLGKTGTWASLPDSTDAKYRYEVDNQQYSDTGTIRLRATGKVGTETRSITADLRQKGFIDFLYFTDYEMQDPIQTTNTNCKVDKYRYAGRASGCDIQFANADVIGGPVHSNDTLVICGGARFKGVVTTGNPAGGYASGSSSASCSTGTPTFDLGAPAYSPAISLPETNKQLQKETRSDLTNDDVPRPGCLYTGPTSIKFIADGKMIVKSPWTKFTSSTGDPNVGNNNLSAQCGDITALKTGATIPVPANNVIYVQNIPVSGANSATDAQTTGPATVVNKVTNTAACLNPVTNTKLKNNKGYSQNVVGYPIADEVPIIGGTESTASYGCRNGDVFVEGQLSGGALTIAAQNYVYATSDITYKNSDTDMLGLVGENTVWVYNPVDDGDDPLLGKNRTISAAILSLVHTFMVQNYTKGPTSTTAPYGRGTLTVFGAIAQKYRGTVAVSNGTGYTKNYTYDTRYRYTAPPKFLSPVTTTYGVNIWVEVSAAFNSDGTYR